MLELLLGAVYLVVFSEGSVAIPDADCRGVLDMHAAGVQLPPL